MARLMAIVAAIITAILLSLVSADGRAADGKTAVARYVRDYGYITLPDGTQLAYVAYWPRDAVRHPVVLQYDPYLGGASEPERLFLDHGYAFIAVSVHGTGCSTGTWGAFSPREMDDGVRVVDWIAQQRWSDGNVGMWGYSCPGHTALFVAERRPPALKAVIAGSVTSDLYDGGLYPGGIFNVSLAGRWSRLLQPRLDEIGVRARIAWGDIQCRANAAGHSASTAFSEYVHHPEVDQYWRDRSTARAIGQIAVPTMLVHSWQDHLLQTGPELYAGLRAPKQIVLLPGGHAFGQVQTAVTKATLRWFDRWLKGEHNGVEGEPPVTVLWEIGPEIPFVERWSTRHADWPVPETAPARLALSPSGELQASTIGANTPDHPLSYVYPIGAELAGSNLQFAIPPDPVGSLTWTTPPMNVDMTILGAPELDLYLSSAQADTDVMVVLHDVWPNGDVEFLQRALLRASHRSTPPSQLTPGQPALLQIAIPPVGAVIRKGHRLQLAVLAPSAVPQSDWGFAALDLPGLNQIHSGARFPSTLTIPVLKNAPVPPPAPACGSLPYQPCRAAAESPRIWQAEVPRTAAQR